jgi:hypothetical protein
VTQPDPNAVQRALTEAVEGALSAHGEYATKWVLVAESLGADGERGLWLATAKGAKPWDTLGLFGFAVELERTKIIADRFGLES